MVYDRVLPLFLKRILPTVREDKTVLVVAHGNSLRALVKYIENISDADVADLEIPFSTIIIYELDEEGHMVHKEIRERQ
jgi:2,3-bisphosphoglycerate-dependent phosphoglycerate mutase